MHHSIFSSKTCQSNRTQISIDSSVGTVGLILRRLRSIRGLSQGDLALAARANLSYINTIENHPSNLSIRKLLDICNGMQIGPALVISLIEQDIQCFDVKQNKMPASHSRSDTLCSIPRHYSHHR